MALLKTAAASLLFSLCLSAHPMGNFSISHYSRIELSRKEVRVTYILDFAEIPTFELLQKWGVPAEAVNSNPHGAQSEAMIRRSVRAESATWLANLRLSLNGKVEPIQFTDVQTKLSEGAGGMAVMRVEMLASLQTPHGGDLILEDANFPSRTGWKEIVVRSTDEVPVTQSSATSNDLSLGLTRYPTDPGVVPPQDVRATVSWAVPVVSPMTATSTLRQIEKRPTPTKTDLPGRPGVDAAIKTKDATEPAAPPAAGSSAGAFGTRQPGAAGTVVAGDFLSAMLHNRRFGLGSVLLGLLAAFTLGAFHALSPGHGKTIVAAYLVGSRGTLKHAAFLGFMVTFTHTASVFLLGIGVLFFQRYVVPDRIIPVLGMVSGLSIVLIGGWLLYQRAKALTHAHHGQEHHTHYHRAHEHHQLEHHDHKHSLSHHHHANEHAHAHDHSVNAALSVSSGTAVLTAEYDPHPHPHQTHDHDHGGHRHPHAPHHHDHSHHDHANHHDGFVHTHTHDGVTHSHAMPGDKITLGSLVALGASGGLVPCPSALVLMLSAIALGHAALGLALLTSFSAGLALVLMAVGGLVLFAKNQLPQTDGMRQHPFFRLAPVFSAVVVMILGVLMTLSAAGILKPLRLLA